MKWLLVAATLIAGAGSAQSLLGWSECTYNKPDERIVSVRVSLLTPEGAVYSYRTLKDSSLKTQVVTFKTATTETLLGGMQLDCEYSVPNLKSYTSKQTPMWLQPVKVPAGTAPKLGVLVDDSTGFRRVQIGAR